MHSIVAEQCVWPNCAIKRILKLDCFLAKASTSRHIKRISPLYSRISFQNCTETKVCNVPLSYCWCCRQG